MGIAAALAELLFPTRCAGCEMPGAVLCPSCHDALPRIVAPDACPRCGAPYGRLVCTECWEREFAFEAAVALGELAAPLARAVVLHKDGGERRLGELFGGMLAACAGDLWPGWAQGVVFVPATPAALRRRGFDHARAIARGLAAELGVPLLDAMERRDVRDQRALGRTGRVENVAGSFRVTGALPARLLLCDDVFTTGATLDVAAGALLDAGALAVRVAVVARSW